MATAGEIEVREFGPDVEGDVVEIVSAYTASWPIHARLTPA